MNTEIKHYSNLDAMPDNVRKAIKTMGHIKKGDLRSIAWESSRFRIDGCLVLFENNKPIGWGVCYNQYCSFSRRRARSASFWIQRRYRGKGYGAHLILQGYERWRHLKPKVFFKVNTIWQALDICRRFEKKLQLAA